MPINVLIIDDSATIRALYQQLLSDVPDIQVVGVAVDALDARDQVKRLNPHVLTLDIEMPGMDGLAFLEKIMTLRPMPVIMASTLTQKGADASIRALELGAVDCIGKPTDIQTPEGMRRMKAELTSKIRAAAAARILARATAPTSVQALPSLPALSDPAIDLIAFGSSTGGVEALRSIFQQLPNNMPPIVFAQHMLEQFTPALATRLNAISGIAIGEAQHGARLLPGHAYLAPGGRHLRVTRQGSQLISRVEPGAPISGHCPSVDALFHSVAGAAAERAVGVLMTGMGKDGAQGLQAMRERGARTIGQSESSCVVYGMPKAAQALGAVETELSLADIPRRLVSLVTQQKTARHAV